MKKKFKSHIKRLIAWNKKVLEMHLPPEEFMEVMEKAFGVTGLQKAGMLKALKIAEKEGSIRAGDCMKLFNLGGNPTGELQ